MNARFIVRQYWLVAVWNIVVVLVATEVMLRLLGLPHLLHSHSHPQQFARVLDADVVYVNVPDTSIEFTYDGNLRGYFHEGNIVEHRTNSRGFRGPEFEEKKRSGTKRVVFLGDSFTFGEGVYFPDTYPEQFRAKAIRSHLFSGAAVESINTGVGGFNTWQEWSLLSHFASKWEPDVIVVGYTLNDAEPPLFSHAIGDLVRRDREANVPEDIDPTEDQPFFARVSHLGAFLRQQYLARAKSARTIEYYRSLYRDENPSWRTTREALRKLGAYSKETHVPVVLMVFPLLFRLDRYPFENIHATLLKEADADGLVYIDLLPLLKNRRDTELWVHPTDQHPNEVVHRIAAEALVERLKDF